MKKLILCTMAYLMVALSYKVVSADEIKPLADEARIEAYISGLYQQIDFGKCDQLSYEVFNKAFHGYLNLKHAGKLSTEKEIISICDFNLPSTANRLWIIDLTRKKVLYNTYVAHGQGSGEEFANAFSNRNDSHQSSLGFYVTTDTYNGEHGTSLRLQGMDQGFNDAAYNRGIVVHGAKYVSNRFINSTDRLGRSWGCPAVPQELSLPIINTIKDGTCLFICYPDQKYVSSSYWLNKKINMLPDNIYADMTPMGLRKPGRVRTIEYVHNGKIDSVRTVSLQ